jgi:RimJ/RimL family protein N-acetyltransferase
MDISFFPVWALRLRTPRLELRPAREAEVLDLVELSGRGVHDPATMPFVVPWTDQPPPERDRGTLQHHLACWAELTAQTWRLPFAVYAGDECVGTQTVLAEDFAVLRTVETGSWLGRDHQGRGFGKEMRAAALHLAFECLGATHAITGAFEDNAASLGVTRSLGYRPNGERLRVRRGTVARELRFVMDADDWSATASLLSPTEAVGVTSDLLAQLGATEPLTGP